MVYCIYIYILYVYILYIYIHTIYIYMQYIYIYIQYIYICSIIHYMKNTTQLSTKLFIHSYKYIGIIRNTTASCNHLFLRYCGLFNVFNINCITVLCYFIAIILTLFYVSIPVVYCYFIIFYYLITVVA